MSCSGDRHAGFRLRLKRTRGGAYHQKCRFFLRDSAFWGPRRQNSQCEPRPWIAPVRNPSLPPGSGWRPEPCRRNNRAAGKSRRSNSSARSTISRQSNPSVRPAKSPSTVTFESSPRSYAEDRDRRGRFSKQNFDEPEFASYNRVNKRGVGVRCESLPIVANARAVRRLHNGPGSRHNAFPSSNPNRHPFSREIRAANSKAWRRKGRIAAVLNGVRLERWANSTVCGVTV